MEGLELKYLESQKDLMTLILKRNELENEEDLILNSKEFVFQAEETLRCQILFFQLVLTELTEYLDSLNEMDLETWEGYKLECSLEEEKIEINSEIERLKTELPELINTRDEINHIKTAYQEFESRSQRSFLESKKMLKHQFAKHHSIIPSLEKILVYKLSAKNIGETSINELPTKLEGLKIELKDLAKWSNEYTPLIEGIFNDPDKRPNSIEKGKGFAVRFSLLKLLGFEKTPEFLALSEGQKVAFIRFILVCDESTAKGLKNGYEKYIETRHEKEAMELFDKIKKGDIL
jgi:hypothetical protein